MSVRDLVFERAQGGCERCGRDLTYEFWSQHHRQPRGLGGTSKPDRPSNLLLLDGSGTSGCHGWVESHREEAMRFGWLVSQYSEPSLEPVLRRGVWVLLDDEGGWTPVQEAA